MPKQKPTRLCFGGSDLKTITLSSLRSGVPAAALAARVETRGLPEHDDAGHAA